MPGWPSLAGYLTHRPGGPLGRLQSRRRWFLLDESLGELLGYKRETDVGDEKAQICIDIKKAALSLSLDDNRQLVILTNDREDVLVAENHETMMVWLLALQAKRDACNNLGESESGNNQDRPWVVPQDRELQTFLRKTSSRCRQLRVGSTDAELGSSSSLDALSFDGGDVVESSSLPFEPFWEASLQGHDGSLPKNQEDCLSVKSSEVGSVPSSAKDVATDVRVKDLEARLVSTKSELAQALNREASLKTVIQEQETRIENLQHRVHRSPSLTNLLKKFDSVSTEDILRRHNKFLVEEVLRLSRLWQREQTRVNELERTLEDHVEKLNQLKRGLVLLLQSCIRISVNDGPESPEVILFGGSKPKQIVLSLVEEARRLNPSLPSFDGMIRAGCHVDSFGFRHLHMNDGLTLHYLCRHLTAHYSAQISASEVVAARWELLLNSSEHYTSRKKEVKSLVRAGIPSHLRSQVWVSLVKERVEEIMYDKEPHYYSHLVNMAPESQSVTQYRRQISLDLLRTMPNNIHFNDYCADGVKKMQEVLQAFCLHNPKTGYCQGMNFIVGMCLLFMEPEYAFWCLVAITEKLFPAHYYDQSLAGAQADQEVLRELVRDHLPNLSSHLLRYDVELCTVTLNWFLAVFFDCVPLETLVRIWDCFLLEGPKVLFRFSLAILKHSENAILEKKDAVSIMRQIKAAAKLFFDADGLIQIAFEQLKPFPRRSDINSRQICYYKTLREASMKVKMEKQNTESKERLAKRRLQELVSFMGDQTSIECATLFDKDKLWLCQGHQSFGQVFKVNSSENIMYKLNIEFDSRVMCVHAINDGLLLLGTLSHGIHAFNSHSREKVWTLELNDAVLSICSYRDQSKTSAYAALADGTIAMLEDVTRNNRFSPTPLYIQISSSPISCLRLIGEQLWCASTNRVTILNARTLDVIDQFVISSNSMDVISHLVQDEHGVWIAVRGSSILQVWDPNSLVCKMMFDVRDNKYSHGYRDDDSGFNPSRVTALLPHANTLWVGTGNGSLLIFDITAHCINKVGSNVNGTLPYDHEMRTLGIPEMSTFCDVDNVIEISGKPKLARDRSDSGYQTVGTQASARDTWTSQRWDETEPCADGCSTPTIRGSSSAEFSPRPSCGERVDESAEPNIAVRPTTLTRRHSHQSSTIANHAWKFQKRPLAHDLGVNRQYNEKLERFFGSYLDRRQYLRRRHSVALTDVGGLRPLTEVSPNPSECSDSCRRCPQFGSFDDVSHLLTGSHESIISSSPLCDSYEYDDVFVTYTEDERIIDGIENKGSRKGIRCANELMDLMKPINNNNNKHANNNCPTSIPVNIEYVNIFNPLRGGQYNWSSLDDVSTPSHVEYDSVQDSQTRMDMATLGVDTFCRTAKSSDSGSFVSYSSTEVPFTLQLSVREKSKIGEQPVRVLLSFHSNGEDCIISCSGSCTDDEAVLKWTLEEEGQLWVSDPIVEVCPYTNKVKPSMFARSRLPRRSSSTGSITGILPARNSLPKTSIQCTNDKRNKTQMAKQGN